MDKLLRWRDFAQKVQGKDFWSWIFDGPQSKDFLSDFSKSFAQEATQETTQETSFPRSDIYMNEFEIIVLVEMTGVKKEDIQLSIAGDHLEIKGLVHSSWPKHTSVSLERFYGPFERIIKLPEIVNKERVSAKFEMGLLEVHLAREQQVAAEKINIE